jgi:hypothetical protein
MTNYELAINEEGEPFAVPPEVYGWRVRRSSDGRGRPALVHARGKGKPLIVPVDASHADLLAAAGPGRYRLEAVDAEQHRIDGVPAACTGPLVADGAPCDDELREEPAAGKTHLEAVIYQMGQMAVANTRIAEKAVEQMSTVMSGVAQIGAVMSGVAELLRAAHSAGITSRVPPALPPAPLVFDIGDSDEDDQEADQDDGSADEIDEEVSNAPAVAVTTSAIPEMVQFIIKETIAKAVPLIFDRLGSGGTVAGLPLEAILDWRKAVPTAAPTANEVMPGGSVAAPSAEPTSAPAAPPAAATPVANPEVPATATYAGAAPSGAPLGAVPAGMAPPPATSSPENPEDAAALLNAHIMRVWQGLSPTERTRAGELIAQLPSEGRAELLAQLARLSVPEAIARARTLLDPPPPPTA